MSAWSHVQKVLLAHPPSGLYRRDDRCQSRVEDQTIQVVFPPLDLAYMAAVLEREGITVRIEDSPAGGTTWEEFRHRVETFSPELVVLGATQPTLSNDRRAAGMIKEWVPGVLMGARGEVFSSDSEAILASMPEFDFVLQGETDITLADVLRQGTPEGVGGVTYRVETGIHVGPERPPLEDLDQLPFPARHLLRNDLYRSPDTGRLLTTIQTGRGCPSQCTFCSVHAVAGAKARHRSPENVCAEVRECVERYGIREFLFHADTFTLNRKWVTELCRRIVQADLEIRWGCNSRVDTVDAERLEWMKRAGCWVIGFGVESGSDKTLRRMRKGARREDAVKAIRMCKAAGIRTHAFFVFGFPWETEEDIKETIEFARELDTDFFDFNIVYPLPGTDIYSTVVEEGLFDPERVRNGGYAAATVRTHHVSAERLEQLRRRALWRLYLRPRYIARTLARAGSVGGAVRYTKAAVQRARGLLRQQS